ncbi:hypothetical protein G9A89_007116 [Geosiphon pyriformis]|nr:hypothetical protein G9A89_007116 [Geosiphon pyriformis]
MPKEIQLLTWKKTRIELPTNPSYHYISGSAINISAIGTSTSTMTSTFGRFPFQNKQKKKIFLESYSTTGYTQNPNSQNYLNLLVTPEDITSDNPEANQKPLINNILPAIIMKNKLLNAIFPFEPEEPSNMSLFSRTALEKKPITVMYTNAKVNNHSIKLILDNGSASSIITRQLMDQLDYQVD